MDSARPVADGRAVRHATAGTRVEQSFGTATPDKNICRPILSSKTLGKEGQRLEQQFEQSLQEVLRGRHRQCQRHDRHMYRNPRRTMASLVIGGACIVRTISKCWRDPQGTEFLRSLPTRRRRASRPVATWHRTRAHSVPPPCRIRSGPSFLLGQLRREVQQRSKAKAQQA
jgi:hypothetical protein